MSNIDYEYKGKELVLELKGHIDSANSAMVEDRINVIKEGHEIDRIVVDCEKLEYISSAGLRIILRLKKNVADTSLINVSTDVYEVLDVTGFTEMMDVKKAFRVIDVEGCEVIGQGANGVVYRLSPDTVVKCFHNPDSLQEIDHERDLARTAFITGLPTAIPFDIVRIASGGYGSVFEMLNATNCAKAIIRGEKTVDEVAQICVDLLKQIHETVIKPELVPDMRETVIGWASFLEDYLPVDVYKKLYEMVVAIPEDNHLVHGDYHMKNVMLQNGEAMLIDMDTLCHGNPIYEFASIFNAYVGFENVGINTTKEFFGVPYEQCKELFDKIMHKYFNDKNDEEIKAISEKAAIIGYTRVMRRTIRRNGFETEEGRKTIEKCKDILCDLIPKYDTLMY